MNPTCRPRWWGSAGGRRDYWIPVTVSDGKADDGSPDSAVDDTVSVGIKVGDVNEPGAIRRAGNIHPGKGGPFGGPRDQRRIRRSGMASGDTLVYMPPWSNRWYRSKDGIDWGNPFAENSAVYTPTAADVGYYLRVRTSYQDAHGRQTPRGDDDQPGEVRQQVAAVSPRQPSPAMWTRTPRRVRTSATR